MTGLGRDVLVLFGSPVASCGGSTSPRGLRWSRASPKLHSAPQPSGDSGGGGIAPPCIPMPASGQRCMRGPGAPAGTNRCSPAWDIWPGLGGSRSCGRPRNRGHRGGFGGVGGAARGLTHFVHPASPKQPRWLAGSPCDPSRGAQPGCHRPEHPVPCTVAGGFPSSPAPSLRYGSRMAAVSPGCWHGARGHSPSGNHSPPKFLPHPPRDRDSPAGISEWVINKSPAGSLSAARLYF